MAGLLSKCTNRQLISNRGRKFHRAKKKPARRDELFVQAFVSLELGAALHEPHFHAQLYRDLTALAINSSALRKSVRELTSSQQASSTVIAGRLPPSRN
jgi:hypothetical protein